MRITVGTPKNRRSLWRYQDVPTDRKGWVNNLDYHPAPFEICCLKIENKSKPINGWWTGTDWYGLRLKYTDNILGWKVNKEAI